MKIKKIQEILHGNHMNGAFSLGSKHAAMPFRLFRDPGQRGAVSKELLKCKLFHSKAEEAIYQKFHTDERSGRLRSQREGLERAAELLELFVPGPAFWPRRQLRMKQSDNCDYCDRYT